MNPNFVADIYAHTGKKKLGKRLLEKEITRDEYYQKVHDSCYVKLVGVSIIFKQIADNYGPIFIKTKSRTEKVGKRTKHEIYIRQFQHLKKVEGEYPSSRVFKPWGSWIDLDNPGLKVELMMSRRDVPNKPTR
jgi:hypothetical protein